MTTICKNFCFSKDTFGLAETQTNFAKISFLCSKLSFLINVFTPDKVSFNQILNFIGEDYLTTVNPNVDFTKWEFCFFFSNEKVDMQLTPENVSQQLELSGNYVIVNCNDD